MIKLDSTSKTCTYHHVEYERGYRDSITVEPYNGIHGIGFKRHMKSDFCDAIHPVEYYIKN